MKYNHISIENRKTITKNLLVCSMCVLGQCVDSPMRSMSKRDRIYATKMKRKSGID